MGAFTVASAPLLELFRDVSQAACKDAALPMIAGIVVHGATDEKERNVLVATATDRYVALHGSIPATGQLPMPIHLTNDQVAQVINTLRPYASRKRVGAAETEIFVDGDRVTFRQVALDRLGDVAVTFTIKNELKLPEVGKILTDAMEREPSSEPFHVDGARLAVLARIAGSRHARVRMQSTGPGKPVMVQIGDELIALLMPVRVGEEKAKPLIVPVYPAPILDQVAPSSGRAA